MAALSTVMQEIEDASSKFIFVDSSNRGRNATRIRRHVMRDIGKQRRSRDRPSASSLSRMRLPLHVAPAVLGSSNPAESGFPTPDEEERRQIQPARWHITAIGNARLDPFAKYPIAMDRRSLELVWYSTCVYGQGESVADGHVQCLKRACRITTLSIDMYGIRLHFQARPHFTKSCLCFPST